MQRNDGGWKWRTKAGATGGGGVSTLILSQRRCWFGRAVTARQTDINPENRIQLFRCYSTLYSLALPHSKISHLES